MQPQDYCGILLIDGKYVPVNELEKETLEMRYKGLLPKSSKHHKVKKGLVLLPFMDYLTHDVVIHVMASSENMYELRKGFKKLKELNYDLKILVCDESMGEIAAVAKEFYPDVIIQLCLKHYSANIDRVFKVNGAKRSIKSLQKKLDKLNDSFLISTYHYARQSALTLVNQIAELEYEYHPLIRIQQIFQSIFREAETQEEIDRLEDELNAFIATIDLDTCKYADRIRKRYSDYYEKRDQLIAFVHYPDLDIPKTTNLIEGFNSTTLEIRLGSIRGFESETTARNYMNALILKYRFHKFTDCKKKFKKLNGKSPLEIATPLHHLKNLRSRDWVELCRELKPKNAP